MNESDRFVTVGTFPDVSLAYLAKGRLEEAGIACFIANENTGGWIIGLPTNWPEVQVAEQDALRAIAVLEGAFGPDEPDLPDGQTEAPEGAITLRDQFARFGARSAVEAEATEPPDAEEKERPAIDKAEPEDLSATARRAFQAALIGLLFGPVVVAFSRYLVFAVVPIVAYSIYLLVRVWESQEPLTEKARVRAWLAVAINATVIAGTAYFIRLVVSTYD